MELVVVVLAITNLLTVAALVYRSRRSPTAAMEALSVHAELRRETDFDGPWLLDDDVDAPSHLDADGLIAYDADVLMRIARELPGPLPVTTDREIHAVRLLARRGDAMYNRRTGFAEVRRFRAGDDPFGLDAGVFGGSARGAGGIFGSV